LARAVASGVVAFSLLVGCAPLGGAPRPNDACDEAAGESPERTADRLLYAWAPTFVQAVAADHAAHDRPTRIDFDGDWDSTNNWDHLPARGAPPPAAAYGAAVLTAHHAYLTYTLYYPRDWASPVCVPYICHDNDLESALLVIALDRAPGTDGALVLAETKRHHGYDAVAGGEVARDADGRPLFAVESGGHGAHPCRTEDDAACEPSPGRTRYRLAGAGGRAGAAEPYELLSLRDALWARRSIAGHAASLWAESPLWYRGERHGRLGAPLGIAMAGRRFRGTVRPPWGLRAPAGERGDWFLDPAAVVAARYPAVVAPDGDAQRYTFHPFLDDLRRECGGDRCARIAVARESGQTEQWASLGAVGMLLAASLWRARLRMANRR
jgi:hypothetical protein